jgi:hypothetical protein
VLHSDPIYTEVWPRVLTFPMPAEYCDWGMNAKGEMWEHSLCIMDDFGNAVPEQGFQYTLEELQPYLSPDIKDFNNPPPDFTRENYPYILHTPMPH